MGNPIHIVVVDDDDMVRSLMRNVLSREGYQVTAVSDGEAAIHVIKSTPVHLVITDWRLLGEDGIEILERVRRLDHTIMGIVMTGYGTIDAAVTAMKAGAFDFILKPLEIAVLLNAVTKALEAQQCRQATGCRNTLEDQYRLGQIVGASEPMQRVLEFVEKVADSDSTVLIHGESGTGKELIARTLHFNSRRRDHPLVPVNCGAIPENLLETELFGHEKGAFTGAISTRRGRFELANGGTLFLDEIGEMSLSLQVKLLRVLQERSFERLGGSKTIEVDVRVIAATNQDLEQAVHDKRFREDLFYRLNVIPVTLPPLRERRSDIPLLVEHFIARFNRARHASIESIDPNAMEYLLRYGWPGNIREVENLIERMVVLKKTGIITTSDLPDKVLQHGSAPVLSPDAPPHFNGSGIDLMGELERHESRLIMEALRQANGVTSKAAQLLHLNRTTLVEKLKRKGLARTHSRTSLSSLAEPSSRVPSTI
jgi:DNA-binding NtrC family response regulator